MSETLIAGKWEMYIGNVVFPASILGDIEVNYAEGVVEAETQAGTRKQPSGKASEAEVAATIYVENFDTIRKAFSLANTDPIVFGGQNCATKNAVPVHIHQVCNGKDAKSDIHIYSGTIRTKFNPTLSVGDAMAIEVAIDMQPTADGYMLLGYPSPETPQYWDAATTAWKAKQD